ncbi:DUF6221 family protein [Streptomyces longwoodensis]|uniref:DUF6221 family protein n=1 Tax=Streptomyces longwoodensis TaxID=68231 RepID=UPI00224CBDEF|nr:DUF6221 family protein [Streptomyces longwoodensis]MCX4993825.1 DUF6221 family protein [Streptomyces longwoodensis]MCX4998055.1 DUF6221 family protein [Streptomyces longwoodensis]
MDELVAWLRAQLDEDERTAQAASPGPWYVNAEHDEVMAVDDVTVAEGFALSGRQLRATVDHIARHDPARVLREIDTKRRLLDLHRPYVPEPNQSCLGCAGGIMFSSCPVVRLLALSYTDRPGYREEWRP